MHNTLERRKQHFSQALGLATKMKVTKIMLVFLFNSFFLATLVATVKIMIKHVNRFTPALTIDKETSLLCNHGKGYTYKQSWNCM